MAEVRNNAANNRFEMDLPEGVAFANYVKQDAAYVVTHTETPRASRRRGHGAELVHGMLELIRAESARIAPVCSFVADYMRRHPETLDLLRQAARRA